MVRIAAFIFSKDRACQLRLLLESFSVNCPNLFRPLVLFKASSPKFQAGYDLLSREKMCEKLDVKWIPERKSLYDHFLQVLDYVHNRGDIFAIFTDDCVFYRKCDVPAVQITTEGMLDKVFCHSFRLGLNTQRQDYVRNTWQEPLRPSEIEYCPPFVRWQWKLRDKDTNYGYVSGQDGCTYRASDYLDLVKDWNFGTFRNLEGSLSNARRDQIKRPYLSSFAQSCVINIPTNSVQADPTLSGTKFHCDIETLNDKYLDGEVIDLKAFDFSNVLGCHEEHEYKFKSLLEEPGV